MTAHDVDRPFVSGVDLSRRLYETAVAPLLQRDFPTLSYSAGLIGSGSEVLGFDTSRSSDHHWGPRVMVFLRDADLRAHQADINRLMANELPRSQDGYPTNFTEPQDDGSQLLRPVDHGPINHRVEIHTLPAYLMHYVGFSDATSMSDHDWLVTPQQRLRTLVAGALFHDGLGTLTQMRNALRWYPDHIWRALLAAQWGRIGQEEAFPGRCSEVGDDLGSRIVTARLVRDLMRLCFLMERTYAPYSKWLGTGFSKLECAPAILPHLTSAVDAASWESREEALVDAYRKIAAMHNNLELTEPQPTEPSQFHGRPFRVIHGEQFADALTASTENGLHALVSKIGAIDQWVDSTDVLGYPDHYRRTQAMYAEEIAKGPA